MVCSVCKNIKLSSNFDQNRYMGIWYEALRSKTIKCEKNDGVFDSYILNENKTVNVLTGYYDSKKNKSITKTGTAGLLSPNGWIKFVWYKPRQDYRVLETDYENFAIVHSCNTFLGCKWEWTWVMTREKNPSPELIDNAFQILKGKIPKSNIQDFYATKQGGNIMYPKELNTV